MGIIIHNALIIETHDKKQANEIRKKAISIFGSNQVSQVLISKINDYHWIFIAPDGSKEGFNDSIKGDEERAKFIQWIKDNFRTNNKECNEKFADIIEVTFGSDANRSSARTVIRERK